MAGFTIQTDYYQDPKYIFDSFLQVEKWNDFKGYGMIPGIKNAKFITKTDSIKGSLIQVQNTDGSSHKEEFLEFEENKYLKIKMYDFSRPLSIFAEYFIEEWVLRKESDHYKIERSMNLYGKGFLSKLLLSIIAKSLKNAIQKHTEYVVQKIDRYIENK